jgi:hypothetical protein
MSQIKIFIVVSLVLMLSACGGGGAEVKTTTTNTTMGQELMDLDASYKQGILNEKEYKKAKKNIMRRYEK